MMYRQISYPLGFLLLILIGCDTSDPTLSTNPTIVSADSVDFGDPYEIAADTQIPRLNAPDVLLTVRYSGGCADHVFDLNARTEGRTTEIWLQHDGKDDMCDAYPSESLTVRLSQAVLTATHIVLLSPDGKTYALR